MISEHSMGYLLEIRNQVLGRPALDSPCVVVDRLSTTVGEQVDGGATAEDAAGRHDQRATAHGFFLNAFIEEGVGVTGQDVIEQKDGVGDVEQALVVPASLDDQNRQGRVRITQARCYHATCGATCVKKKLVSSRGLHVDELKLSTATRVRPRRLAQGCTNLRQ